MSVADTPLKFMILASILYLIVGCFFGQDFPSGGYPAVLVSDGRGVRCQPYLVWDCTSQARRKFCDHTSDWI